MAAMDLDVGAIEQQLNEIEVQKSRARERLEHLNPRGRGAGRGAFDRLRGRGGRYGGRDEAFGRGFESQEPGRRTFDDRSLASTDKEPSGHGPNWDDRPGRREQESSVFNRMGPGNWRGDSRAPEHGRAPGGRQTDSRIPSERSRVPSDRFDRPPTSDNRANPSRPLSHRLGPHPSDPPISQQPPRQRPKLSSAVVVNGDTIIPSTAADAPADAAAPAVGMKRPAADVAPDSAAAKRTRRFLGSLLVGTLNRAKQEASAFQESEVAAKRAEVLRKAEERQAAESQRLREEARQQRLEQRRQELNNISSLNLQADLKGLELLYAKRVARQQQLLRLLLTKAGPPVYWGPAQQCAETEELLQQRADEFDGWKAEQLARLAEEQQALQEAHAQRRANIARRIQHALKTGQDDVADEEEGELQQQQAAAAGGAKKPALRSVVVQQEQEQQQEEQQQGSDYGEEDAAAGAAAGVDEEGELTAEALRQQEEQHLAEAKRLAEQAEEEDILGMGMDE